MQALPALLVPSREDSTERWPLHCPHRRGSHSHLHVPSRSDHHLPSPKTGQALACTSVWEGAGQAPGSPVRGLGLGTLAEHPCGLGASRQEGQLSHTHSHTPRARVSSQVHTHWFVSNTQSHTHHTLTHSPAHIHSQAHLHTHHSFALTRMITQQAWCSAYPPWLLAGPDPWTGQPRGPHNCPRAWGQPARSPRSAWPPTWLS